MNFKRDRKKGKNIKLCVGGGGEMLEELDKGKIYILCIRNF